jgi:hypothetical protein
VVIDSEAGADEVPIAPTELGTGVPVPVTTGMEVPLGRKVEVAV